MLVVALKVGSTLCSCLYPQFSCFWRWNGAVSLYVLNAYVLWCSNCSLSMYFSTVYACTSMVRKLLMTWTIFVGEFEAGMTLPLRLYSLIWYTHYLTIKQQAWFTRLGLVRSCLWRWVALSALTYHGLCTDSGLPAVIVRQWLGFLLLLDWSTDYIHVYMYRWAEVLLYFIDS